MQTIGLHYNVWLKLKSFRCPYDYCRVATKIHALQKLNLKSAVCETVFTFFYAYTENACALVCIYCLIYLDDYLAWNFVNLFDFFILQGLYLLKEPTLLRAV